MRLSDLILSVGDENVRLQNLLDSAETINKTKDGTKIAFYTDAIQAEELVLGEPKMIGLVIWLPKELVDRARAQEQEG